jgi:hypothetical protein
MAIENHFALTAVLNPFGKQQLAHYDTLHLPSFTLT